MAIGAELAAFARDDEQPQDAFAFDVTACRYAEFYKELGEPELGFLLVCSGDFDMAEGFGPDIKFARTQTIMQGASLATSGTNDQVCRGAIGRARTFNPECTRMSSSLSRFGGIGGLFA